MGFGLPKVNLPNLPNLPDPVQKLGQAVGVDVPNYVSNPTGELYKATAKGIGNVFQKPKKPTAPGLPESTALNNPYAGGQNSLDAVTVDPGQLQQLNLQGQDYSAARSQALGDVNRQSAAGLAGAQTQLAASGGLSAADRMALASQFNRDKIQGRQSALGQFAGLEAQSAADADRANQMYNLEQQSRNLYETAGARERALGRGMDRDMLERQLQASGEISAAQAEAARDKRSKAEKLLDPGGFFGGIF